MVSSKLSSTAWIKIECPELTKIHKFSIRGREEGSIVDWKFQGSLDNNVWDDLYEAKNERNDNDKQNERNDKL